MANRIIIPGIAKSGTSYLTRKLSESGLAMWADNYNKHYEDMYLLLNLRRITQRNGMDYWFDKSKHYPGNSKQVLKLLTMFRERYNVTGFKNPRLLFFMRELEQIFPDAKFIFCVRNPKDWLRSVKRNNRKLRNREAEQVLMRYYHYALGVAQDYLRSGKGFTFFYDRGEELAHQEELQEFVGCKIDLADFKSKTYARRETN